MSGYGSLRCCLDGTDEELMELRSAVTELSRYTTSLDDLKLLLLIALRIRQEREGTIEDAEEAIALGRGLIGERSAEIEDVVWLIAGSELAYSLENLHSQVGDARYLDEAIELRYRINDAELTSSVFDNDEKFLSTTRLTNNLMLLPEPKCRQKEITEATPTTIPERLQQAGSDVSKYGGLRRGLKGTDEELEELRTAVGESSSSRDVSLDHPKLLLLVALRVRHERENKTEDIEEAIALGRDLIGEPSVDVTDKLQLVAGSELAYFLSHRYGRDRDAGDLDEMIDLRYRIVDAELATSVFDNDERVYLITNLAFGLEIRFFRTSQPKDINDAVTLKHRAVQLANPGDVDSRVHLGDTLRIRYASYRNGQDAEDCITACREAISLFAPGTSADNRSVAYHYLAEVFEIRFRHLGEKKDIDDCIDARRNAVETATRSVSDILLSDLFLHLAYSYHLRFARYCDVEDIHLAVENYRRTDEHCDPSHEDYADYLYHLSLSLFGLFSASAQLQHIDECINVLRRAQLSISPSSPFLNEINARLCITYSVRFANYGDKADIDAAFDVYNGTEHSQIHRDELCSKLIFVLGNLLYEFCNPSDIDEDVKNAIAYLRTSLDVMRDEGADREALGGTLLHLGTALDVQSRHLKDSAVIDESIQLLEEAAKNLSTTDRYAYGFCLTKLGGAYSTRYSWSKNDDDYESSLRSYRMASEALPGNDLLLEYSSMELGNLLLNQFQDNGREEVRRDAIQHLQMPSNLESFATSYIWRLIKAGEMEVEIGEIESAFYTYRRAIELLPRLAWIGYSAPFQLDRMIDPALHSLVNDAAAISILLAERTPEQEQYFLGEAVRLLDQGRSVVWSQASSLRPETEDLRATHPELADDLERCAQFLRAGNFEADGSLDETQAQTRRREAERFEKLVDDVRQREGFEQFLVPLSITEIQKAASEGPIVIVNASQTRCDALVIESGKPLRVIALTGLTPDVATELTQQFVDHVAAFEDHRPKPMNSLMNRIWSLIGHPILEALGLLDHRQSPLRRVWWCLTGQLTFLPIHACFPEEPKMMISRKKPRKPLAGMMDLVVSSYTPTISALVRAQSQQRKAASMDPHSSSANSILIVAQSEEVPDGIPLPNAKLEADAVRKIVVAHGGTEPTVLMNADATAETVPRQLETCSWAHFSCHAVQKPDAPMQSALLMSNGPLTLERLAKTPTSHSQFTYLSACQSAKGDNELANESVHVAAGMQYVGFPSVVGAMWSIRDDYGRIVAESFYESVYEGEEETVDVGRALHNAIQNLRKTRMDISVSQWAQFIHIGVGKVQRV